MPTRKKSKLHQDFIEVIYKLADLLNLKEIDYVVNYGSDEIDSFSSGTNKVELSGYVDGQKVKQKLIVKWRPINDYRDHFRESYKREYIFYQYIGPKYLEIQRNFNVIEGLKLKILNCIYASAEYDKESIVVRDLDGQRYKFHNRFSEIDLDHVSLVVKNLAKMHALSFVWARTDPTEFLKIRNLCSKDVQYSDVSRVPNHMKFYYDTSVNVVSDLVAKEELKALSSDIFSILHECTLPVENYGAFCHGDCWTNNAIFKYTGRRPIEVILVDYQLGRYASPATDLSYFLYMSTSGEILFKHYDRVLDIYYGTLTAVLRQCNLDINDVYPKSIFTEHLQRYSVFGLIEALISMLIITSPTEKALQLTEATDHPPRELNCGKDCPYMTGYVKRVNDVVKHFFERKYSLRSVLSE
ncbi:uncharacterized protein LOC101746639 [Bombyx mori]|uniref:CHK kinase-like domain-containing protein n=1 Tax=Bombyx mori TaxID=7091 RepID=A0A8R2GAH5_BOMMO|nr:uncharacterized protein LOC101746639 isoform X1 [Bombyx mori]XP_021207571.1 uncharacterized protein LOC101746639 isoform X1 [Bombyx mori]